MGVSAVPQGEGQGSQQGCEGCKGHHGGGEADLVDGDAEQEHRQGTHGAGQHHGVAEDAAAHVVFGSGLQGDRGTGHHIAAAEAEENQGGNGDQRRVGGEGYLDVEDGEHGRRKIPNAAGVQRGLCRFTLAEIGKISITSNMGVALTFRKGIGGMRYQDRFGVSPGRNVEIATRKQISEHGCQWPLANS